MPSDGIRVEFELHKEGLDKLTYREIYPRGIVGTFYLTRIVAFLKWDKVPKRLTAVITPFDEE